MHCTASCLLAAMDSCKGALVSCCVWTDGSFTLQVIWLCGYLNTSLSHWTEYLRMR